MKLILIPGAIIVGLCQIFISGFSELDKYRNTEETHWAVYIFSICFYGLFFKLLINN